MKNSYKKIITPLYVINIAFQSLISLVSPIAIMFLISWLLVKYTAVGTWIYALLIMIGVFSGLYSMVSFILSATRALEAIEKSSLQEDKKSNK